MTPRAVMLAALVGALSCDREREPEKPPAPADASPVIAAPSVDSNVATPIPRPKIKDRSAPFTALCLALFDEDPSAANRENVGFAAGDPARRYADDGREAMAKKEHVAAARAFAHASRIGKPRWEYPLELAIALTATGDLTRARVALVEALAIGGEPAKLAAQSRPELEALRRESWFAEALDRKQ